MSETNEIAAGLLAHLPPHKCELTLTHNPHTSNYETVEDYMVWRKLDESDWVSPEQRAKAVETNDFWEVQWYPETPVGFNYLCAADLGALLTATASEPAPQLKGTNVMAGSAAAAVQARIAAASAMAQLSTQMAAQALTVSPSATPADILTSTSVAAQTVSVNLNQLEI